VPRQRGIDPNSTFPHPSLHQHSAREHNLFESRIGAARADTSEFARM